MSMFLWVDKDRYTCEKPANGPPVLFMLYIFLGGVTTWLGR